MSAAESNTITMTAFSGEAMAQVLDELEETPAENVSGATHDDMVAKIDRSPGTRGCLVCGSRLKPRPRPLILTAYEPIGMAIVFPVCDSEKCVAEAGQEIQRRDGWAPIEFRL